MYHLFHTWDWPAANAELQRAMTLDPSNSDPLHFYGHYLEIVGRTDEAVSDITEGVGSRPSCARHQCGIRICAVFGAPLRRSRSGVNGRLWKWTAPFLTPPGLWRRPSTGSAALTQRSPSWRRFGKPAVSRSLWRSPPRMLPRDARRKRVAFWRSSSHRKSSWMPALSLRYTPSCTIPSRRSDGSRRPTNSDRQPFPLSRSIPDSILFRSDSRFADLLRRLKLA